jgi:hypothetical protein
MKIAICIPSHNYVHLGFAKSLANLTSHLAKSGVDFEIFSALGTVIPDLRQILANRALQSGSDYLLWLDSDMHFPKDTVDQLLAHNKDIVAATYSTRVKPLRSVAFINQHDLDARLDAKTGLHKVWAVGMGCMLVSRKVFETLPKPWFTHIYNEAEDNFVGEDIYFCRQANEYGFKTFIDVDLSKQVAHYGIKAFILDETDEYS